ncbi:MAG: TlpA family protein disulfide reductase [Rhodocyclaceae bacterium]|nr:TlpA family protein disulfide reductase [Rhodocyclaceae bacterium]
MKRLLCGLLFLAACSQGEPAKPLNIADPAPAFTARRLDGQTVHFPSFAAERPLVLRFWADWCRYCEAEMQLLDTVSRRYADRRLLVIAVNVGQDADTVRRFMDKIAVAYPALLDERAQIAKSYGVKGLPTTFFIDTRGIVRGKIVGEADEALFVRHIEGLFSP